MATAAAAAGKIIAVKFNSPCRERGAEGSVAER